MPNSLGGASSNSLASLFSTPTITPNDLLKMAYGSNMTAPIPDVFSALRRDHVISLCSECGNVEMPGYRGLKCKFCDLEYEGELALRKLVVAGEEMVATIQEGKCPGCGCHNMDRIAASRRCRCGNKVVHYLPLHRHDQTYGVIVGSSDSTSTEWIPMPYTTGTSTIPYMTTSTAGTMYVGTTA